MRSVALVSGLLKRGVDPPQGVADKVELFVGHVSAEVIVYSCKVDRGRGTQPISACLGDLRVGGASVRRVARSGHEAAAFEFIDESADAGPRQDDLLAELTHLKLPIRRSVQFEQDVVPGQRQSCGVPELSVEHRHQIGVHVQQRSPRTLPVIVTLGRCLPGHDRKFITCVCAHATDNMRARTHIGVDDDQVAAHILVASRRGL